MKILVIDNYDSFTYNLIQLLRETSKHSITVFMNDKVDFEAIKEFDKILLSPGPGLPSESGDLLKVIKEYASSKSFLGICLGHQAIAEAFGAKLFNLANVIHGEASKISFTENESYLFRNISSGLNVGRYHSWAVDKKSLPSELKITAIDNQDIIMAIQHAKYDIQGLQFHPESVLTEHGKKIITNWINN